MSVRMYMLTTGRVYNLDCFEFLRNVKPGSIDLAIIDPPYNLKKAEWDTFKSEDDFYDFTYKWIDALIPTLKAGGSLYIFNTPFHAAHILPHLVRRGLTFQNWITWDKRDGLGSAKKRYSNGQETILFFTNGGKHTFNYNAIRVPYESAGRIEHAKTKGILKNGKRWFPSPLGKYCGEVWHIASERHQRKVAGRTQKMAHVTPKPMEMIERIIKASSNIGDLVLDCFVGSGTTAVAAKKMGRRYICSDADQSYVLIAEQNLKAIYER